MQEQTKEPQTVCSSQLQQSIHIDECIHTQLHGTSDTYAISPASPMNETAA